MPGLPSAGKDASSACSGPEHSCHPPGQSRGKLVTDNHGSRLHSQCGSRVWRIPEKGGGGGSQGYPLRALRLVQACGLFTRWAFGGTGRASWSPHGGRATSASQAGKSGADLGPVNALVAGAILLDDPAGFAFLAFTSTAEALMPGSLSVTPRLGPARDSMRADPHLRQGSRTYIHWALYGGWRSSLDTASADRAHCGRTHPQARARPSGRGICTRVP